MIAPSEPITAAHNCAAFDSGELALDEWLRRRALANQAARASRSFVACAGDAVVGFYCLAAGAVAVAPGEVKRNMPDPIPVLVLGRLAVDRRWQGRGLGRALLRDAALRSLQASQALGIRAMLVQALNDRARGFYLGCGFTPSPVDPFVLTVTMADLAAAVDSS